MTDTTKKLTIEPLEGWTLQTPYGTLKNSRGEPLVRLEDVHAWLMQKNGIPSVSAAVKVFAVFTSDNGSELSFKHGSAKVRSQLYITDLAEYADPIDGFSGSRYLEKVTDQIPYVSYEYDRGTVEAVIYALGIAAGEVWAPHKQNTDLNDRLDGYCAEGYFPSIERCIEILGHFAVPIALAHALWGWGRVVEVVGSVAKVTPLHSVLEANAEPTNWPQLIEFRKTFPGTEWSIKQKNIVANEAKTRTAVPGSTGVKESMAGELGCSVTHINKLIREKDDAGKKAKTRTTAETAFPRSVSSSSAKS